jgi:cell division protein ZipA
MLELRWVLLGLGILLIVGIYLWPRFSFILKPDKKSDYDFRVSSAEAKLHAASKDLSDEAAKQPKVISSIPKKVVTIRFIPRSGGELNAELAVLALRKAGLKHGKYDIFHYPSGEDEVEEESEFSVASLIEPGAFDLTNLKETTLPGMSFFMILPGLGDPVSRFDRMASVARALTQSLDSELFDEQGSSWSIQRERYVREEIIDYHHQKTRA